MGSTSDHFTWLTPQQQQRRSHQKPPLTGSLPNLLFPYLQTQVITYLLCSPPSQSDCLDSPHLLQQAVPLCQRSGSPHCWSQIPGTIPRTLAFSAVAHSPDQPQLSHCHLSEPGLPVLSVPGAHRHPSHTHQAAQDCPAPLASDTWPTTSRTSVSAQRPGWNTVPALTPHSSVQSMRGC